MHDLLILVKRNGLVGVELPRVDQALIDKLYQRGWSAPELDLPPEAGGREGYISGEYVGDYCWYRETADDVYIVDNTRVRHMVVQHPILETAFVVLEPIDRLARGSCWRPCGLLAVERLTLDPELRVVK